MKVNYSTYYHCDECKLCNKCIGYGIIQHKLCEHCNCTGYIGDCLCCNNEWYISHQQTWSIKLSYDNRIITIKNGGNKFSDNTFTDLIININIDDEKYYMD